MRGWTSELVLLGLTRTVWCYGSYQPQNILGVEYNPVVNFHAVGQDDVRLLACLLLRSFGSVVTFRLSKRGCNTHNVRIEFQHTQQSPMHHDTAN